MVLCNSIVSNRCGEVRLVRNKFITCLPLIVLLNKDNIRSRWITHERRRFINHDIIHIIKNNSWTCLCIAIAKFHISELQTINMACIQTISRKNTEMCWLWIIADKFRNIVRALNPATILSIPLHSRKEARLCRKPSELL